MPKERTHYGAGTVEPKGNTWLGRFYVDGVPKKKSLGLRKEVDPKRGKTKKQAEQALAKFRASYKLPNPGAETPFREVAVAHIARQHLRGEINDRTKYDYERCLENHLEPEFGDKGIGEPKHAEIQAFQDKLLRKLKPESVRIYMSVLSGVFTYAVGEGMRDDHPCAAVKRPKKGKEGELRVLFSAELDQVIAKVPKDDLGEVERRLYPFSAKEGLRQAESTKRLKWRHCEFEGRNIRVYETKSGKNRVVPMASDVAAMLKAWRKITQWDKDDDLVFAHPATGQPIDASVLLQRFQRCVLRADVGDFKYDHFREGKLWPKWPLTTFHDLRHSFGTSLAMAGVPLPKIQKWLGHARIETTMIYIDYVPSEEEADVLDRALGNAVASVPLG